jgi:hypothetical protein
MGKTFPLKLVLPPLWTTEEDIEGKHVTWWQDESQDALAGANTALIFYSWELNRLSIIGTGVSVASAITWRNRGICPLLLVLLDSFVDVIDMSVIHPWLLLTEHPSYNIQWGKFCSFCRNYYAGCPMKCLPNFVGFFTGLFWVKSAISAWV